MAVNLCQRVNLVPTPVVRDGCSVIEFVSAVPTRVTPEGGRNPGECHCICAEPVFDRSTGTIRVAMQSCEVQTVGDFAVAPADAADPLEPGTLVVPMYGEICGSVVIFTTSNLCWPTARVDITCPPDGISAHCFRDPPEGVSCIYCVMPEELGCSIEQLPLTPCGTGSNGRSPSICPGARVIPGPTSPDVYGNVDEFLASDPDGGPNGRVSYYLGPLAGEVDPVFPDPNLCGFSGRCCQWLCHIRMAYAGLKGWEIHCNKPHWESGDVFPTGPEDRSLRPFYIYPFARHVVYVHFSFLGQDDPCFLLANQYCLTHGNGSPYWDHHTQGDPKLETLHHLAIDMNCQIATDPEVYPHAEPEYVLIANDALAEVGEDTTQVGAGNNQGHASGRKYDSRSLDLWWHDAGFRGRPGRPEAPAVRNSNGEPWTVYVIPYGTNARFPADLVLARLRMGLHVSIEHSNHGPEHPPESGVRLPATFLLTLNLGPRLREGWQDLAQAAGVVFANDDPYDVETVPGRPIVVASDGCSRVPLEVQWRGLNAPRPWSRSLFEYEGGPCAAGTCCDFLYGLDGLVIPGEVNDTSDVEAPQRYEGDVVLTLNIAPEDIGCGCP